MSYIFGNQVNNVTVFTTNWTVEIPPNTETQTVKLIDAIAAVIESKERANFSPIYLKALRQYLILFARGREQMSVADVTVETLENWFRMRKEKPETMRGNVGRLSSMFGYCVRRGWMAGNPCDRLEPVKVIHKSPRILSVDEAKMLLEFCREQSPQVLAWLVLGMFTGIRPHELFALKWDRVNLESRTVIIDAATSKVRSRRIVPLGDAAVAWLKLCDREKPLMLCRDTIRFHRYRLGCEIGYRKWPQDLLRHTAASYLLAMHQDAPRVAYWLGNSPRILMSHYWSLTTKEDAERFFAIRP